jgi:16S rRNA C967 or C1407 C5-methylase (RsmB/RsmF family)
MKFYIPAELIHSKSGTIRRLDCTNPLAHRNLSIGGAGYDKVLVDARCSSERHVIHAHLAAQVGGRTAPEMANWRPGSSKRLATTQAELIMTGLRAAKIGGSIVYATCSIEQMEKDGVIEKVLSTVNKEVKKGGKWSIKIGFNNGAGDSNLEHALEQEWTERTKYGWIVLPDHPSSGKYGPLFFVLLTKVEVREL